MQRDGDFLPWLKLGDADNIYFKQSLILTTVMSVTSVRETMKQTSTPQHEKEVTSGAIPKLHNHE